MLAIVSLETKGVICRYGNKALDASLPIWQQSGMDHPLKTFREEHDPPLNQGELADLLDVEKSTVWRWEANKRKIDKELLPRVAEFTGIDPARLRPDLADLFKQEAAE